MKNCFSYLAVLFLMLFLFLSPVKAAGPAIAGHYLTTGQILVGVTGSAPVANALVGTSGQITATQGAEGGYMQLAFPTNVQMTNLTVTGTLSPYSTGTLTTDSLAVNYGITSATAAFSGAVTAATTLAVQGQVLFGSNTNATVSTITAAGVATFAGLVTAPTMTVSGGAFKPYSRTLAQLNGITPGGAGEVYYCSDCLAHIAVSSGTGTGAFTTSASSTTHIN